MKTATRKQKSIDVDLTKAEKVEDSELIAQMHSHANMIMLIARLIGIPPHAEMLRFGQYILINNENNVIDPGDLSSIYGMSLLREPRK